MGEFYGYGPKPPDNVSSAKLGGGDYGGGETLDNGRDEDVSTLLDLFQDEIKSPLAHNQFRDELVLYL